MRFKIKLDARGSNIPRDLMVEYRNSKMGSANFLFQKFLIKKRCVKGKIAIFEQEKSANNITKN